MYGMARHSASTFDFHDFGSQGGRATFACGVQTCCRYFHQGNHTPLFNIKDHGVSVPASPSAHVQQAATVLCRTVQVGAADAGRVCRAGGLVSSIMCCTAPSPTCQWRSASTWYIYTTQNEEGTLDDWAVTGGICVQNSVPYPRPPLPKHARLLCRGYLQNLRDAIAEGISAYSCIAWAPWTALGG